MCLTPISKQTCVNVKLFAIARQLAGAGSIELTLPPDATVADVRRSISNAYPALAGMVDQMLIAVDSEYANDETPVTGSHEVACIPPVSGG